MVVNIYVDGFNLYYGCLRGSPYKWLDLDALARRLFPRDTVHRIRYFTALVTARPGNLQAPARQQMYLRALGTIPHVSTHLGHFLTHPVWMPIAHPRRGGATSVEVIKTEEKGSDINLATYLILDAFHRDCETAAVISNDSDLKEPITLVQRELGIPVGVVNPHPASHRSRALQPTFFKQLRLSVLPACQFPSVLQDAQGTFHRPATW